MKHWILMENNTRISIWNVHWSCKPQSQNRGQECGDLISFNLKSVLSKVFVKGYLNTQSSVLLGCLPWSLLIMCKSAKSLLQLLWTPFLGLSIWPTPSCHSNFQQNISLLKGEFPWTQVCTYAQTHMVSNIESWFMSFL